MSLVGTLLPYLNGTFVDDDNVPLVGGGLASGVPGAGLGAAAMVRGFQQPFTLTGLGQALYRLGNVTPPGAAEGVMRGGTGAVVQGVR